MGAVQYPPDMLLLTLLLTGCKDDPTPAEVLAACGNGVVESDEQCDDGAGNSDDAADACRTSCRLPVCGDAVSDSTESCDDGNTWGGDGCTPDCTTESGTLEAEPNDAWDGGQAITDTVHGALTGGDIDCYTFSVAECHTIAASLSGACTVPMVLALHDPAGAQVGASGFDAAGCAVLDPADEPGARFAGVGTWAVCATSLLGDDVPVYTLSVESGESTDYDLPLSDNADFDRDGLIDDCDGDRDGDGFNNDDDNCPDVPNGPDNIIPTVDGSGFIRHWLTIGPFTGESSPDSCLPGETDRLGDDAAAQPRLGDAVDDLTWELFVSEDSRLSLEPDYDYVSAPREVYAASYLYTESTRDLTLGLGPDDGARVWLNGEVVLEVSGCQGTNVDQFTADVTLQAGWNRLLVKVYDQGGGWGTYLRFLDDDGPALDLELSVSPDGGWDFDQTDSDGDGIGDICDDE